MTTFLAIVGAWFLISLPFGIAMGQFCGRRDIAEHLTARDDR